MNKLKSISVSSPDTLFQTPGQSPGEVWYQAAEADYKLCRRFADQFDARLRRSLRSQRVGWERDRKPVYGILIPDPLLSSTTSDEWYLYYVWGETLFRRTETERAQRKMLVLPEATEDWAELLRQALRDEVFDVRYSVAPHHVNAFGETENEPCGYEFTLTAHGPHRVVTSTLEITGTGATPEAGAREAARRWLDRTEHQKLR
jgi:hypothetical protein